MAMAQIAHAPVSPSLLHKHLPTPAAGASIRPPASELGTGCSFTKQAHASLSDSLVSAGLQQYCEAFDTAQIDSELAPTMQMQDFKQLLPDAPLGHLLRLRKLFQTTEQRVPLVPERPILRFRAKFLSTGELDENLAGNLLVWYELIMLVGTLFLTVGISFMFDMPLACADGSACILLRQLDAAFWASSLFAFLLAVVMALLAAVDVLSTRIAELPAFVEANFMFCSLPMAMWVLGNQTLCCGLVTRVLISVPTDLDMGVGLAVLLGSFNVICLCYAFSGIRRLLHVSCTELPMAFHGALGFGD